MARLSSYFITSIFLCISPTIWADSSISPVSLPLMSISDKGVVSVGFEGASLQSNPIVYTQTGNVPFADLGLPGYPNTIAPFGIPLKNQQVSSGHQFSQAVILSYLFPHSATSISLAVQHVGISAQDQYIKPDTSFTVAPFGAGFATAGAKSKLSQSINTVDLTAGNNFNLGSRVDLQPFFGLRWADINDNLDNQYYNNYHFNPNNTSLYVNDEDKIRNHLAGLGPRAGVDLQLNLRDNFALVTRLAGSLLVARQEQTKSYMTPYGPTGDLQLNYDNSDPWAVIPEWDAKLGVNYRYDFWEFELGYEMTNFYQAVSTNGPESMRVSTYGRSYNTFLPSNLVYQGPYARMQLNIA